MAVACTTLPMQIIVKLSYETVLRTKSNISKGNQLVEKEVYTLDSIPNGFAPESLTEMKGKTDNSTRAVGDVSTLLSARAE